MAVRTRIEAIDRDIAVFLDEDLSPEAQGRLFAEAAREARDEALRTNRAALGRETAYTTFVDGRVGASEDAAKLPGTIAYEFDVGTDMLAEIGDLLVKASPARSGRYARSFKIFVDGAEKPTGAPLPEDAEEVLFLNVQPYARKIERGQSDQAPDGVFQAVAAIAMSRFGNFASVKFTYRSLQESGVVSYIPAPRVRGSKGRFVSGPRSEARTRERETRTPALLIRLR